MTGLSIAGFSTAGAGFFGGSIGAVVRVALSSGVSSGVGVGVGVGGANTGGGVSAEADATSTRLASAVTRRLIGDPGDRATSSADSRAGPTPGRRT